MVVRSTLKKVLSRVPFSDRIPEVFKNVLEEQHETKSDVPVITLSPKVKIHNKIINNRNKGGDDKFPVIEEQDEDEIESFGDDDLTINYLNYSDTCDTIPSLSINKLGGAPEGTHSRGSSYSPRTRMAAEESSLASPAPSYLSSGSTVRSTVQQIEHSQQLQSRLGAGTFKVGNAANTATSSTESLRALRTKSYLEEQNEKFDSLISKNIDVFFKQQSTFEEKHEHIVKEKKPKAKESPNFVRRMVNTAVSRGVDQVKAYIPIPAIVLGTTSKDKSLEEEVLNEPIPLSDSTDNSDEEVQKVLETLDGNSKRKLLIQLKQELGEPTDPFDYSDTEGKSSLDKFQMFLIISIKLFIISVKLCIPLGQYVYHKYINNQIYLINNKNASSLFDFMLKLMKGLEHQVSNNEEWITKVYNRESGKKEASEGGGDTDINKKLDSIYEDFTMGATNILRQQFLNGVGGSEDSWRRSIADFVVNKYSPPPAPAKADYNDPKYGIYYSSKHNETVGFPQSASSSISSTSGSYKSMQASAESLQALSVFKIAEKFADEL